MYGSEKVKATIVVLDIVVLLAGQITVVGI